MKKILAELTVSVPEDKVEEAKSIIRKLGPGAKLISIKLIEPKKAPKWPPSLRDVAFVPKS